MNCFLIQIVQECLNHFSVSFTVYDCRDQLKWKLRSMHTENMQFNFPHCPSYSLSTKSFILWALYNTYSL
jgi:hypothetical protein